VGVGEVYIGEEEHCLGVCVCANVDMQEVTAAIIGVHDLHMERNSFHSQLHK
jgi:hypothetical protein